MATEKLWTHITLKDGTKVRFTPPPPDGDMLGGVTKSERDDISKLRSDVGNIQDIADLGDDLVSAIRVASQSGGSGSGGSSIIIDPTLSKPQQAAEAKAVGDAFGAFAPQFRLTPQLFGAVGNGINDDTDAFQAMLNAPDIHNYYIPIGVYRITRPLTYNNGKRQMTMVGEAAFSGHTTGTLGAVNYIEMGNPSSSENVSRFATLSKSASIIFFDYTGDGCMLDLPKKETASDSTYMMRIIIRNLDFISSTFNMKMTAGAADNGISKQTGNASCIRMPNGEVSDCAFVGFSGTALEIDAQHVLVRNLSFFRCNTGLAFDKFNLYSGNGTVSHDNRCEGLWFCLCNNPIQFLNGAYNIRLLNIWADQILGNVITATGTMLRTWLNDCWFDSIGGAIIDCGYIDGATITSSRFNRYGLLNGSAAINVSNNIKTSYFQIESPQTATGLGVDNNPILNYNSGAFDHNVIISPERKNIVSQQGVDKTSSVNATSSNFIIGFDNVKTVDILGEQTLTAEQQAIVQRNIGILSSEGVKFG